MLKLFSLISLAAFQIQVTTSQCLGRQLPSLNYNRQFPEMLLESPGNCNCQTPVPLQPAVIERPPLPNAPVTLITDCTPSVCKNLANTIQLMIVASLLKNGKGSDMAELAMPIINDIVSSPSFSCGCSNPLFTNPIANNIYNPSEIFTNLSPNQITNSFYPDTISPSLISGRIPGLPPNFGATNMKNVIL